MEHVLLRKVRNDKAGHNNVGQGKREQKLPAERHQLVITEARQRAADPNVNKDESDNFQNEPKDRHQRLKYWRQEAGYWSSPSAEEQGGRDTRHREHIAVFRNKEDGEFHRAVFGVISGNELGFRFREIE